MTFRAAVCLLGSLVLSAALGSPPKDAAKTEPEPKYDPATVIDFDAVVIEVKEVQRENPLSGVNLVVKTESDATMGVYLGPADFLKSFELYFRKGDRIHIAGSKVKYGNDSVVLACEVRKESATLFLRDRKGTPSWQPSGKPAS